MASTASTASRFGPRLQAGTTSASAVFVDLDRTLLRGASGLVLGAAMRAEGLFEGRPSLPGERLLYGLYDLRGESLAFMVFVRAAARFVKGWPAEDVVRAGELAAPELVELVQPYAAAVLAEHRRSGRHLVLATTTPLDLIKPFADQVGFDAVVATRYGRDGARYNGGIDGPFVWSLGKVAAVRRWATDHGVELSQSFAYSDSFFDVPLLAAVGHPYAVNPDARLRTTALVRRWPVEHWDRPPGVPTVAGLEPYHLLRHLARPELFPYARFELVGLERLPRRGAAIVVANHRSYFDVAALGLALSHLGRPVRFLAKRELFAAPVIGQLTRALGGICVDREGDAHRALAEAERVLQAGEPVAILPQGTIPRGEAFFDPVLRGKTGAARLAAATGAPVVPIGLWGTEQVWPRSQRLPTVTALRNPPRVQVQVGEPLQVSGRDARRDTKIIMDAIAALLPPEGRRRQRPGTEELARTLPPGHGAQ